MTAIGGTHKVILLFFKNIMLYVRHITCTMYLWDGRYKKDIIFRHYRGNPVQPYIVEIRVIKN